MQIPKKIVNTKIFGIECLLYFLSMVNQIGDIFMKKIKRDYYLNKLIKKQNNRLIKNFIRDRVGY